MIILKQLLTKRRIVGFEIIDDYLSKEDYNRISEKMLSPDFPWHFNNYGSLEPGEDSVHNYQFTHSFYQNLGWVSDFSYLVYPFVDKLSPNALVRIKANLSPPTETNLIGNWHTDYEFECKTAVYYLNNNNGHTQFRSGERVESVANRIVIFDSQDLHVGATATDSKARAIINFNYF